MRYAIALFVAVAAFFVSIGVNQVMTQQERIGTARPISGTVLKSEVLTSESTDSKNRKTVTYRPDVWYRYSIGDVIFSGHSVFPMSTTASKRRSEDVVAQFPAGKSITVWYVPDKMGNPASSFLLREWDFGPYLTILYCMIPLSAGLGFWVARPWRRVRVAARRPAKEGGSWQELEIRTSLRARRHPWRAITLVWFVLGGVAIGHYFVKADRPYGLDALIVAPIYLALGLVPLGYYLRELRAARAMGDARVFVNTGTFRAGKTFDVRVEQRYRRPAKLESMRVGLVCEQSVPVKRKDKTVVGTSTLFESWNEVKSDEEVSAARPLEARTKLTPPAEVPASTADGGAPSEYRWRVVVETKVKGRGIYRAEYPISVEGDDGR